MSHPPPVLDRAVRHVHLLGAGGMGMTPLGLYLRERGFIVSAEDDAWNPATRVVLERAGVTITASNEIPHGATLVVYSPAVAESHSARVAASARGVPQVRRGDMLAEVTRDRRLVAIVGSHGKTTTTALLIAALQKSGFDCGWVLGGLFAGDKLPPARAAGEWVIAEIDESDGTIGRFSPEITVVANLDWDHADHYATAADIENEFAALLARTQQAIFLNAGCTLCAQLILRGGFDAPLFTFGADGDYAFELAEESAAGLRLRLGGKFTAGEARVRARGAFNALNATAALAVAQHLGATVQAETLAEFPGVQRRQTLLLATPELAVIEDYAHHPAEIRALLDSLRAGASRLMVVFQPHRYTRTAQFKVEFARALAAADEIFLLDVYAASEAPVVGGSTADLVAAFGREATQARVTYLPVDWPATRAALLAALRPGDTLAFVGAGDINLFAREFLADVNDRRWREFIAEVRPPLQPDTKLVEREILAPKTTMRVGGPARVYAEPASEAELSVLLATAQRRGLPVFMLGRGSNLIVPDEGVDGLVISLAHPNWQVFESRADGTVWVGAGLRLKNLCGLATKAGLQGFEFMEGIPASVGGALRMNAGAMDGWTFDVVEEVHLMTLAGEKRVMKKSEMHVDYRHCEELETAVALGAVLRPRAHADAAAIKQQIEAYQKKRQASQPREPSAGCIFKNPPGTSAGKVIDECGLKGERVGDAEVSPVHANFIVNRGHATTADILALVRRVRARVKEQRGIDLQPEVMLFGQEWRDVL